MWQADVALDTQHASYGKNAARFLSTQRVSSLIYHWRGIEFNWIHLHLVSIFVKKSSVETAWQVSPSLRPRSSLCRPCGRRGAQSGLQ
eukprot:COSAG01_NODE_11884_length_1841_cov_3.156716_1_plen_87_part_10